MDAPSATTLLGKWKANAHASAGEDPEAVWTQAWTGGPVSSSGVWLEVTVHRGRKLQKLGCNGDEQSIGKKEEKVFSSQLHYGVIHSWINTLFAAFLI